MSSQNEKTLTYFEKDSEWLKNGLVIHDETFKLSISFLPYTFHMTMNQKRLKRKLWIQQSHAHILVSILHNMMQEATPLILLSQLWAGPAQTSHCFIDRSPNFKTTGKNYNIRQVKLIFMLVVFTKKPLKDLLTLTFHWSLTMYSMPPSREGLQCLSITWSPHDTFNGIGKQFDDKTCLGCVFGKEPTLDKIHLRFQQLLFDCYMWGSWKKMVYFLCVSICPSNICSFSVTPSCSSDSSCPPLTSSCSCILSSIKT